MSKELLKLRKNIKAKKPKFFRQDAHKQKELKKNWRRPKGMQSKMRLNKRGYRRSVSTGWGSPKLVYGLHPTGLKEIIVNSIKDIENIEPKTEGIIISKRVGTKNKILIVKKAKELQITILNLKDPEKFLDIIESEIKKKKESKQIKLSEKDKKIKESSKKPDKKEKKLENLTEEEKKKEEKKEKDKLLTKKGA